MMSKLKLSDWKIITAIVGIAVVVFSLVFVSLQVHQHMLTVQPTAAPSVNDNFAGWYSSVQSDSTLTVISVTGMSELSEVGTVEVGTVEVGTVEVGAVEVGPVDSGEAYVLQVGAFRKRVFAAKAANEIRVEALRIIATRRGEQNWYVLVLGTYESYVDAREAGEAYLHAYPKGSIWVRTAADLKKSLIDS